VVGYPASSRARASADPIRPVPKTLIVGFISTPHIDRRDVWIACRRESYGVEGVAPIRTQALVVTCR
jgi:hypothetical protein